MKTNFVKRVILTYAIMLVSAVLVAFFIGCPFYRIFHFPCPACGMTRATMQAAHFDFAGAMKTNPAFWAGILLMILVPFLSDSPKKLWQKLVIAVFICLIAVILVVYVLRIINGDIYSLIY